MSEVKKLTEYVVGFMFSKDRQNVLLIEKDRPEWQAGKLNGVGGKIENQDMINARENELYLTFDSANAFAAMKREFEEETGIITEEDDWELFAITEGENDKVYYFRAFSNKIFQKKQMESEYPTIVPVEYIGFQNTLPNVKYLVPAALYVNSLINIHYIKKKENAQSST